MHGLDGVHMRDPRANARYEYYRLSPTTCDMCPDFAFASEENSPYRSHSKGHYCHHFDLAKAASPR